MLDIETRVVGGVTVIEMNGRISLGEGDELMKDKVNSLLAAGHRKFVLDLTHVRYIDSAGVGEVVRSFTTISRNGGRLVLCSPPNVMYIVGSQSGPLISAFQVGKSVEECLAFFHSSKISFECP